MKLGFVSAILADQSLDEVIAFANNENFSCVELMCWPPGEADRRERAEAFMSRTKEELIGLRDTIDGLKPDQNLVTFENVSVSLLRGDQRTQVCYDNLKSIEEQIITGMHLMPILLGRNYGTTETYGTAQFEIINRQVESVNREHLPLHLRL